MKIKQKDTVLIITGKDKGKKGKVLKTFPLQDKILVEGANIIKKHRRAKNEKEKGQVVQIPKPISISNVKLVCSKCSQATRVGYKGTGRNKKRTCKKCKGEL